MRASDLHLVSREDFLVGEETAASRSEWVNGVVYAMSGASKQHVATVSRLMILLGRAALERSCLIGASDLLVETETAYYYPDLVLSCAPSDHERIERHPCFIVEVLSPSTRRTDRHEKRDAYLAIPTMHDYWIVDIEHRVVEAWTRTAQGWEGGHHTASARLLVECLGVELTVAEITGS